MLKKNNLTNAQERIIADWRVPENYPKDPLKKAPAEFMKDFQERGFDRDQIRKIYWRWSFLRRHKDYQNNWDKLIPQSQEAIDRYGIMSRLPDPEESYPCGLNFSELIRQNYPRKLSIQFDLDLPINKQLINAGAIFRSFVKQGNIASIREQRNFPLYVRILDARAASASYRKIGEVLSSNIDSEDQKDFGNQYYRRALKYQEAICRIVIKKGWTAESWTARPPE